MPDELLSPVEIADSNDSPNRSRVRLLIVVEGTTDITFLKHCAALLPATESSLPDLASLETYGEVVFLPFGGGNVNAWRDRLRPLDLAEFHLYDGELPPESAIRQQAAGHVNARANCRAFATRKRSVENYLHPQAIVAAGGPAVRFSDADNVAEVVALAHHRAHYPTPWMTLPRSRRRKLVHRTKRWLCDQAARAMTMSLLVESDPAGEIRTWLTAIAELLDGRPRSRETL